MKSRKTKKYRSRLTHSQQHITLWVRTFFFYLQKWSSPLIQSQAAKSSSDSDDVAEADREEDAEEEKKEQDETEKEEEKEEKENTEPPSEEDTKKHGFLILSREDSTMVDRCVLHTETLV